MKSTIAIGSLGAIFGLVSYALLQTPSASAQSLQDSLNTRYRLTFGTVLPTGVVVTQPGPVFVVKHEGILATPPTGQAMCIVKFKDGVMRPPARFCKVVAGAGTRYLDVGTKVYLFRFEVNSKKSTIAVNLLECDVCNGVQQSSYLSALEFDFAPKYLDTAEPGQVADVIDQVIALDTSSASPPATPAAAVQPAAAAAPQPTGQSGPPPQIQIGDTTAQVETALGPPDAKAVVGNKVIYVYKNLKVTFVAGKVTDIQ